MANVRSKSRKMGNPSSVRFFVFFWLHPLISRAPYDRNNFQFKFLKSPPVICEQPQMTDYQEGLRKQQLVFEFDVKTWEVGHHFCMLMI